MIEYKNKSSTIPFNGRTLVFAKNGYTFDEFWNEIEAECSIYEYIAKDTLVIQTFFSFEHIMGLRKKLVNYTIIPIIGFWESIKFSTEKENRKFKRFLENTGPLARTEEQLNKILDKINDRGGMFISDEEMFLLNNISEFGFEMLNYKNKSSIPFNGRMLVFARKQGDTFEEFWEEVFMEYKMFEYVCHDTLVVQSCFSFDQIIELRKKLSNYTIIPMIGMWLNVDFHDKEQNEIFQKFLEDSEPLERTEKCLNKILDKISRTGGMMLLHNDEMLLLYDISDLGFEK